MRHRPFVVSLWVAPLLIVSGVFAHHGMEAYDLQRQITVEGTITKFEFANPHVMMYFDAKDGNGTVTHWVAESGSTNMLRRAGWARNSLKPGDSVTISGNPARNGSPIMRFRKVVLPSGRELNPDAAFD